MLGMATTNMRFLMTNYTRYPMVTLIRGFYPAYPEKLLKLTFSRNGWGASAVDALSTALVMENAEVTNTILDYIGTINFGAPVRDSQVSLFETTIRYLGGLLSGD